MGSGRPVDGRRAVTAVTRPASSLRAVVAFAGLSLKMAVLQALAYPAGFWSQGLLGLFWSVAGALPLVAITQLGRGVLGWEGYDLAVLTAFFLIIAGSFAMWLVESMTATIDAIRSGNFDTWLLRPVPAAWQALLAEPNPWRGLEALVGVGVLLWLSWGQVAWTQAALAFLAVVMAVSALQAVGLLVLSFSFRALRLHGAVVLLESSLDVARWPSAVYTGAGALVVRVLLPHLTLTTLPAQLWLGRVDADALLWPAVQLAALWVVAVGRFRWAIRSYASASS